MQQGWVLTQQAPASVMRGIDHIRIETSTVVGAMTSGSALLSLAGAVQVPFAVRFEVLVEVGSHNTLDAGAAILGSFSPPFGSSVERGQMVYLDNRTIGWADDSQAATVIADDAFHTYVLRVNAMNMATFSRDGVDILTRTAFMSNGTIAIGDQTNDANVDGAMRIRSIRKLCL